MCPGAGGAAGERREDVGAHEIRAGCEGGVCGAIVYEEDFPACWMSRGAVGGGLAFAGGAIGLFGLFGGRVFGFEVVHCFFEHSCETMFFVESWYDECDEDFRWFNICC